MVTLSRQPRWHVGFYPGFRYSCMKLHSGIQKVVRPPPPLSGIALLPRLPANDGLALPGQLPLECLRRLLPALPAGGHVRPVVLFLWKMLVWDFICNILCGGGRQVTAFLREGAARPSRRQPNRTRKRLPPTHMASCPQDGRRDGDVRYPYDLRDGLVREGQDT